MIVLSNKQLEEGFALRGEASDQILYDGLGPHFAHPEAAAIKVLFPSKVERLPFLARAITSVCRAAEDFSGATTWVSQSDVWNAKDEAIGKRIIERINAAAGQPADFEIGSAHSFRGDEYIDSLGVLMQSIIAGWDAYYVPQWTFGYEEFFTFVSHDSYAVIVTRTKGFYDQAVEQLQGFKLDIRPDYERGSWFRR
jgi:hypothetical protein